MTNDGYITAKQLEEAIDQIKDAGPKGKIYAFVEPIDGPLLIAANKWIQQKKKLAKKRNK